MRIPNFLHAGVALTGIAVAGIAATPTASAIPVPASRPEPTVAQDVSPVPPGGLLTGVLHNQLVYCSIICPLLAGTGTTAVVRTTADTIVTNAITDAHNRIRAAAAE
ncbi:hypothetical protein [Nocardia aurantia]|uniref:Uncharacterized protein n=1 Tax=Nocardia aurantia TaxID=2585199 RepID=A0A7K0DP42_9NOCA|nr:hypothetical protein [Nocardia aurantia]MQY27368.1 hypothetical protein [Nocardia aurantia]